MNDRLYVPKYEMAFPASVKQLGELTNYKFFTPALLYMFGNFNDVPLFDFLAMHGNSVKLYHKKFNNPIFLGIQRGSSDAAWNYVLWAIEASAWDAFENFMLSVTLFDPATKQTVRVGVQDLLIADPLASDAKHIVSNLMPLLQIAVFGVNGSHACVAMRRRRSVYEMPSVMHCAPQPYMPLYNKALSLDDTAKAEQAIPTRYDTTEQAPIDFRTVPISELPPEKQQELLAAMSEYKKMEGK